MRKRITIIDLQHRAALRGGLCLSGQYLGQKVKHEWQCAHGHQWQATWSNVCQGRWCKTCSSSRAENICRTVLETMFSTDLPRCYPMWLRLKGRAKLELDGFNEEIHVGFEYQGWHHSAAASRGYYKTHDEQRDMHNRDALKRQMCWKRGVRLIVIPEMSERLSIDNLDVFIRHVESCVFVAGIDIPTDWIARMPKSLPEFWIKEERPITDEMRLIAASRNGVCLSTTYVDYSSKLRWRCSEGHEWESIWQTARKGCWCGICGRTGRGQALKDYVAERVALVADDWMDLSISRASLMERSGLSDEALRRHLPKTSRKDFVGRKISDVGPDWFDRSIPTKDIAVRVGVTRQTIQKYLGPRPPT